MLVVQTSNCFLPALFYR